MRKRMMVGMVLVAFGVLLGAMAFGGRASGSPASDAARLEAFNVRISTLEANQMPPPQAVVPGAMVVFDPKSTFYLTRAIGAPSGRLRDQGYSLGCVRHAR